MLQDYPFIRVMADLLPVELLSSPYLDLNPEYQRDVVWKSKP